MTRRDFFKGLIGAAVASIACPLMPKPKPKPAEPDWRAMLRRKNPLLKAIRKNKCKFVKTTEIGRTGYEGEFKGIRMILDD